MAYFPPKTCTPCVSYWPDQPVGHWEGRTRFRYNPHHILLLWYIKKQAVIPERLTVITTVLDTVLSISFHKQRSSYGTLFCHLKLILQRTKVWIYMQVCHSPYLKMPGDPLVAAARVILGNRMKTHQGELSQC